MKQYLFPCQDGRECFAKDEEGRCLALSFTQRTVNNDPETPLVSEALGIQKGKSKQINHVAYGPGQCPFRKECRHDLVVKGELKQRGARECSQCLYMLTGCKGGKT